MSQGTFESLPGTSDLELAEIDSVWDEFQERLEQKEINLDAQKATLRGELQQVSGVWGMDELNRAIERDLNATQEKAASAAQSGKGLYLRA